jgi:hypothetical protein
MRLLDRFRQRQERQKNSREYAKVLGRVNDLMRTDPILAILKNPKAYNRRTRRAVGLRVSPFARPRPAKTHLDCRLGRRAARRQRRLDKANAA